MHSLDSHSTLIDYYLTKTAWQLRYFSLNLKGLFLHILALYKIFHHAIIWFDDGADASPSQGNKDCSDVVFLFLGFMREFASLSLGRSSSMSYCSGLTQQMGISQSSMLIHFLCTRIGHIYCEFHWIYAHPFYNNVYVCFLCDRMTGENGLILAKSEIGLVSNCLQKQRLVWGYLYPLFSSYFCHFE